MLLLPRLMLLLFALSAMAVSAYAMEEDHTGDWMVQSLTAGPRIEPSSLALLPGHYTDDRGCTMEVIQDYENPRALIIDIEKYRGGRFVLAVDVEAGTLVRTPIHCDPKYKIVEKQLAQIQASVVDENSKDFSFVCGGKKDGIEQSSQFRLDFSKKTILSAKHKLRASVWHEASTGKAIIKRWKYTTEEFDCGQFRRQERVRVSHDYYEYR